ncbi:MAG: hypothetical protein AB1810_08175 [Pseudomonadota bacterium]
MSEHPQYTHEELRGGQFPHQLFLFNMVGNHILLSIIALSNSAIPWVALGVPILSCIIFAITFIMGSKQKNHTSEFVRCHWRVALTRTKIFLLAYALMIAAVGLAWMLHSVMPIKEMAYAIVGGLGILPTMVMVLVLTVMESETLNHALHGRIPDSLRAKYLAEPAAAKAE